MLFDCGGENRCVASPWMRRRVRRILQRAVQCVGRWTSCVRGDVFRLRATHRDRGSEQRGARYAVVVQADDLLLSTVLITPTSRSAQPRIFRPTITLGDESTQVLIEQTTAVAADSLGDLVGHVSHAELDDICNALRLAVGLD